MLKVLVKDCSDSTFFLAVISFAGFDPEDSCLWLSFEYGLISIPMDQAHASIVLRNLLVSSFVDLTIYNSRVEWDSD